MKVYKKKLSSDQLSTSYIAIKNVVFRINIDTMSLIQPDEHNPVKQLSLYKHFVTLSPLLPDILTLGDENSSILLTNNSSI